MKVDQLRATSTPDLEKKVSELKTKLFNLRFQLAVGQLENTAEISTTKKTIARIKTIISERERV